MGEFGHSVLWDTNDLPAQNHLGVSSVFEIPFLFIVKNPEHYKHSGLKISQ